MWFSVTHTLHRKERERTCALTLVTFHVHNDQILGNLNIGKMGTHAVCQHAVGLQLRIAVIRIKNVSEYITFFFCNYRPQGSEGLPPLHKDKDKDTFIGPQEYVARTTIQ